MKDFPYKRFMARSKISVCRRRLSRAKDVILDALSMGFSWYVACSAGKDSVALAHMANELCPGIEIWSEKDDFDYPGERAYIEGLADRYGWNLKIVSPPAMGMSKLAQSTGICEDLHSRGTSFSDAFFYQLISEQEALFDGVFLGLRNEESQGRRRNFRARGYIYQRKNGKHTCIPLSAWSAEDVFAYLASREIPILDVYFKTLHFDGDPCKIRKSWYLPSARAASGHCAWLKYYYPELYAKLLTIDSEVSGYV